MNEQLKSLRSRYEGAPEAGAFDAALAEAFRLGVEAQEDTMIHWLIRAGLTPKLNALGKPPRATQPLNIWLDDV